MRHGNTRATLLGRAAVVALALLASGAPRVVLAAAGVEAECSPDCEGSLGGRQCPPTCTSGSCAKTILSVVSTPAEMPAPVGEPARMAHENPEQPSQGAVLGIFHPPKA